MDSTVLRTSGLSLSDIASQRRVSSTCSRHPSDTAAPDILDEKEHAGRRSYEYIKRKPHTSEVRFTQGLGGGGQKVDSIPWRCGEKYQYGSPEAATEAWQKCHSLVKKYDEEMCDAWREEVDKLLIFAGLFSATITAFTIESYRWLETDSGDLSSAYLFFLASEYAKSQNTSLPSFPSLPSSQTQVTSTSVRINIFWFLSLTLSLTTVLIGILCLQWLREFQRSSSPLPPKSSLALRQMRFSGLVAWRVPAILSALPVLLQSSLLLFFAGLLDLLWNRNAIVAGVISVVVGLVVCFLGATSALPALQFAFCRDEKLRSDQCPYKSPQSWLILRITQVVFRAAQLLLASWTSESIDVPHIQRVLKSSTAINWSELDMRWRGHRDASSISRGTPKDLTDSIDIVSSLIWVNNTFGTSSPDVILPLYHSLPGLSLSAASVLITTLYEGTPFDASTFRVMMDDKFSNNLVQKREIVSTFYLHLHDALHGGIVKPLYIESVIRILNSQDVPAPFLDWLSTILQEIVHAVVTPGSRSCPIVGGGDERLIDEGLGMLGAPLSGMTDERIIAQAVACAGSLAARDGRRNLDVVNAFILLDVLLWGRTVTSTATSTNTSKTSTTGFYVSSQTRSLSALSTKHLRLATTLFHNLRKWVNSTPKQLDLRDRVEICMEGLLHVFPDDLTVDELREFDDQFGEIGFLEDAGDLVRVLQEASIRVGAVPGVIRRGSGKSNSRRQLPESAAAKEYHKRSEGDSLERWWKLVRTFSALSREEDHNLNLASL